MAAVSVHEGDTGTRRAMRRDLRGVAPPQPYLMAGERKIARGRERTVAAAEYCNLQMASPCGLPGT